MNNNIPLPESPWGMPGDPYGPMDYSVVFLSKTPYPLLSTGSSQEDKKSFGHDWKISEWDIFSKHQHKHMLL